MLRKNFYQCIHIVQLILLITYISELAGKIRLKVLAKTDEIYINIDTDYIRALDMFRFSYSLSLYAISKTLNDEEKINKYDLERRQDIFPVDLLHCLDQFIETQLPPKDAIFSKIKTNW